MGSENGTFVTSYPKSIMKETQERKGDAQMIKYDKLWDTMKSKGITKYTLHKEYNEGVSMNTINTLCNILDCNIEDIATHYKD